MPAISELAEKNLSMNMTAALLGKACFVSGAPVEIWHIHLAVKEQMFDGSLPGEASAFLWSKWNSIIFKTRSDWASA